MQMLYLCNIQTITTANIKQIFVIQNIFNQKVRDMEEKKINEAQVAEQTTSQDENMNTADYKKLYEEQTANLGDAEDCVNRLNEDNERLMAENADLLKKYESEKKSCLRYYRQMNMLKQAITKLTEEGKVTEEDVVKAVLTGQNLMSLDDLLYTLAD